MNRDIHGNWYESGLFRILIYSFFSALTVFCEHYQKVLSGYCIQFLNCNARHKTVTSYKQRFPLRKMKAPNDNEGVGRGDCHGVIENFKMFVAD